MTAAARPLITSGALFLGVLYLAAMLEAGAYFRKKRKK